MKGSKDDERKPGLADAAGRAAFFPARAAARAWRGPIEEAVDEVLSAPEIARVIDRALAGSLPEEIARSLVRHRVIERIAAELAASGELERLVAGALAEPADARAHRQGARERRDASALRHVASSPELRDAIARQTTGLADEVVGGLRASAARLDDRAEQVVRRPPRSERSPYGGIATRAIALATDGLVTIVLFMAIVGIAALMGSLVGGLRPEWLVGVLLGSGWMLVVGVYFVLFWSTAGQTPGMRLLHVRVAAPAARPRRSVDRSCASSGSCSRSCRCSRASCRCCSPIGDAACPTSWRAPSSSTTRSPSRGMASVISNGRELYPLYHPPRARMDDTLTHRRCRGNLERAAMNIVWGFVIIVAP